MGKPYFDPPPIILNFTLRMWILHGSKYFEIFEIETFTKYWGGQSTVCPLRLSNNQLISTMSDNIGKLVNLIEFIVSNNNLEGVLPNEVTELIYLGKTFLLFTQYLTF